MLIRSIGSIWTATLRLIDPPTRGANATLTINRKCPLFQGKFRGGDLKVKLPQLSIATKLYAIFALLATVTVALAAVAVYNARSHAGLTAEFEAAFTGAMNVERVNGLIYA